jgi:hypothetical protein
MLTAFLAQPVVAMEPPPRPGSCPRALKPLPRSVNASVDRIVKGITPQWRETLLKTKRDELVQYQTTWGKGIRDSLCLLAGGNDQLLRDACDGKLCHPDDASLIIMESVWDRLQSVRKVLRPPQAEI